VGVLELLPHLHHRPVWTTVQEYLLTVGCGACLDNIAGELVVERPEDDFDPEFLQKVKKKANNKEALPRKLVFIESAGRLAATESVIPGDYAVSLKAGGNVFGPKKIAVKDQAVVSDLGR